MSSFRKLNKQLLDAMDCPCSALSINCCQLGCFIHDEPLVDYSASNEDWMQQVMQANPNVTLRSLVIPASHDSATSTIAKKQLFSAVGKCQNATVANQLERGCRYLDLRVAGSGDAHSISICHGFLQGGSFQSVLKEIHSFLQSHKKEFVVLELVKEHGRPMTPEQAKHALDLVQTTFDGMLYREKGLFALLSDKPLKEHVDAGVQVAVLVHPRIYNGFTVQGQDYDEKYIVDTYRYYHSGRWMRSQWHNTRDTAQLLEWNLDQVHKWGDNEGVLLNNQFVLTPGVGGMGDVLQLLVGKISLRPVSLATSLYQQDVLDEFMREHADEPWNMVMLDFVDLAPALLSFLIGLNFPLRVKVLAAAVSPGGGSGSSSSSSTDVTTKVQSFVKRGKVLYLTNVRKDLGLDYDEGSLTLAYQLGTDGDRQILHLDFDPSTEIVVSQYSHNEGVFVHVDPKAEGVFHRGRILRRDEYESIATKEGTAVAIRSGAFSIVN